MKLGLDVEFRDGMRVSPPEVMEIVKMVLLGKVNQELVIEMNNHGHLAVGLAGSDAFMMKAKQLDPGLGMVGYVSGIDTTLLRDLLERDYIPIIASIAVDADGLAYNVNADLAAGELAAAIGAQKVIFLTDVDGLYEDFSDKDSLISDLKLSEARAIIDSGSLDKGMIPKMEACVKSLEAGVPRAHILNGTIPHSLLLEIFTDHGIGTMIAPDSEDDISDEFETSPLNNLALKLHYDE
jgi:acetylglutamate kinase